MVDNIWINGPLELIQHGFSHIQKENDFDLRIAMISIDNAAELAIKTYLALNKRSLSIDYKRYKESIQRFPVMLNLLQEFIPNKISNEELDGIEMFHNLRNNLYHQGNGITVQLNAVNQYLVIVKDLISRLFDVEIEDKINYESSDNEFLLNGEFLLEWRKLEQNLIKICDLLGFNQGRFISPRGCIKILNDNNKINKETYYNFMSLNTFKNELVHSVRNASSDEFKIKIESIKKLNKDLIEEFSL